MCARWYVKWRIYLLIQVAIKAHGPVIFLLCPVSYAIKMKLSFIWYNVRTRYHLNELVFQPRLYTSLLDIGSFSPKSFPCMQYWSWITNPWVSIFQVDLVRWYNSSLGISDFYQKLSYKKPPLYNWTPLSSQYVGQIKSDRQLDQIYYITVTVYILSTYLAVYSTKRFWQKQHLLNQVHF